MRAFEGVNQVSGGGVWWPFPDTPKNRQTVGQTPAGQFGAIDIKNNNLQVSGKVSGAVWPVVLAAVCLVGVSLGHPTPDTQTRASHKPHDGGLNDG